MKEISYLLKLKEVGKFKTVYLYNTGNMLSDMFYIIIKGLVSIQAPNPLLGKKSEFNAMR